MNKPHKHAALIKLWADGTEIQWQTSDGRWVDISIPNWNEAIEFRVKPGPLRYRNYLGKVVMGPIFVAVVTEPENVVEPREGKSFFLRWLGDWQEVPEELK